MRIVTMSEMRNQENSVFFQMLYSKTATDNREIYIYELSDVIPCGNSLCYPNTLFYGKHVNRLYLPTNEKTMSLNSGTKYEQCGMEFEFNGTDSQRKHDGPLFYFIYNVDNYYHFVYDTLPYLITYFHLKQKVGSGSLKLLMNYPNDRIGKFYPFVMEFLDLLGITRDDIVIIEKDCTYKRVYVSSSYTHDGMSSDPPRSEIFELYRNIVKNAINKYNGSGSMLPKKIYVSRRTWIHNDLSNIGTNYTTRRKCDNEDELIEVLKRHQYEEVFTEKLSTIEKIILFNNATHVVGAIGGGICNVLFSKPSTRLIALVSPTFLDVNSRFRYSLDVVNTVYFMNTYHTEKDGWKLYMRIKWHDIIGEIEEVRGDKLLISYVDEGVTGWNSAIVFKKMEISKDEAVQLDNGLNSRWKVDIEDLERGFRHSGAI